MTAKAGVTPLSRTEAIMHPDTQVLTSSAPLEPTGVVVEAGFDISTPGADYLWYDCSGDTLE